MKLDLFPEPEPEPEPEVEPPPIKRTKTIRPSYNENDASDFHDPELDRKIAAVGEAASKLARNKKKKSIAPTPAPPPNSPQQPQEEWQKRGTQDIIQAVQVAKGSTQPCSSKQAEKRDKQWNLTTFEAHKKELKVILQREKLNKSGRADDVKTLKQIADMANVDSDTGDEDEEEEVSEKLIRYYSLNSFPMQIQYFIISLPPAIHFFYFIFNFSFLSLEAQKVQEGDVRWQDQRFRTTLAVHLSWICPDREGKSSLKGKDRYEGVGL